MAYRRILTLARFTLLEAWRTRLPGLFLIALALACGTAYFFQQLAITESVRLQIIFSAAASRLAAVFVLGLYILTSIVREFNDKGLELTLSFDLRRADYVVGRLLGFLLIGTVMALMASIPQLLLAPAAAVAQWGISLALELAIVTALSLFCVMTFTQLMPAAAFVAGFYVLARALSAIQLMSTSPLAVENPVSRQFVGWLIDGLTLIMPALDRYTQSAWLADAAAGRQSALALRKRCCMSPCSLLQRCSIFTAATFDCARRTPAQRSTTARICRTARSTGFAHCHAMGPTQACCARGSARSRATGHSLTGSRTG